MIPNPIHKALSIFQNSSVRFLLMGGQACILYGAAEFSRDLDLSIGISPENLVLLKKTLKDLNAEQVFFPHLDPDALIRGHACHFRCHTPETEGLRIDLMTKMRGCLDFSNLWQRRTVVRLPEIGEIGLLSLPDLVQSKKTQRDKDWPMIRRLIEVDINHFRDNPTEKQVRFWFRECRTPSFLVDMASEMPGICQEISRERHLLKFALTGEMEKLEKQLILEEIQVKKKDREYWLPLRKELEQWRREKKFNNR